MKNLRFVKSLLLLCCVLLCAWETRAQGEARVATWQVTRFDITANVESGAAARGVSARAVVSARNVGAGEGRSFTVRLNPLAEVKATSVGGAQARFTTSTEPLTNLLRAQVVLPAPVEPGGTVNVTVEYRLPVNDNTGLAAVSGDGAQFLPLSYWYPTPNTALAPRGVDYAPTRVTVNTTGGESIVATGQATGGTFEQTLNVQPFFLTGKWDVVEGAGEARGVSAWLASGASADERRRAEALVQLAAAARSFYAGLLGAAPDAPVRLVSVRRGAGFDMGGTLLVDGAVFRRTKTDSLTALQIAESVARLWMGGATGLEGEGAGVLREGLPRFLATLFLEKQFGREAADAERMRIALLYAPAARRDGPLSKSSPAYETYYNTVANKGALVWRLVADKMVGRDAFVGVLRREFDPARKGVATLAGIRAALSSTLTNDARRRLFDSMFDQPTDTDLLVGLPRQSGGQWVSALRNMGSLDVEVVVEATTERGERVTATTVVPAKDFGEARFQTPARIVRVEIDPDKLYPQLDYSNDIVPHAPAPETALAEARALLAQQQAARAETLARETLARAPELQEARVVLGRALLDQNRLDEAEREFRAALDAPLPTAATLAWANIGLGEIALRRNQAAEAVKRFDEAVRAEAEYASTLNARAARIRAEAATGAAPAVDEAVRGTVAQLDAAIKSGRKADLDAFILPGELANFEKGIISSQPEIWQTRVLRTETVGANRVAADVSITARTLGQDQSGTAVLVFARTPGGWRLADVQFFEVR
jgi:hypothetical protein